MTGKEAIHFVRTLQDHEVKALLWNPKTSATVELVCCMRLHEPDEWRRLLRELGLADLTARRATR